MSLRCLTKYATATLAVAACVFVASGVRAVESNDAQREATGPTAFFDPVSAPCHPALGACAKRSQPVAEGVKGDPRALGYEQGAPIIDRDPVSSPCHPALKACANWARKI
jgi:hypothetical protein